MPAFALLVLVALAGPAPAAASATPTPAKHKLLVLDVAAPDLDKPQRDTLTQLIASRAARFPSLQVMSSADIRELVALEADKQQVASCDAESASCLAELAGAMGAELVLTTRAGKLDAVYVVSLQLFDAKAATAVGRASVQGWSLAELPDKIGPAVDDMIAKATGDKPVEAEKPHEKHLTLADKIEGPLSPPVRLGLEVGGGVGVGVGVIAAVLGVVPALQYAAAKDDLRRRTDSFTGASGQLAAAADVRKSALADKATYNGIGRVGVIGGLSLAVLGGAALATALLVPGDVPGDAE